MKKYIKCLAKLKLFATVKYSLILFVFGYCHFVFADAIDDATADDISSLCSDSPANELFKIANKNSNPQELRANAVEMMIEVSRECSGASTQRLTQFHQKLISVSHKVLGLSELNSRRCGVEGFQYVMLQADNVQPSQGSINRGQTIANLALNDSDTKIRLWALEALVTLRGDNPTIQQTLQSAASDSEVIVQQTASSMLAELF